MTQELPIQVLELAAQERRVYLARLRLPRRVWTPAGLRVLCSAVPAPGPSWLEQELQAMCPARHEREERSAIPKGAIRGDVAHRIGA